MEASNSNSIKPPTDRDHIRAVIAGQVLVNYLGRAAGNATDEDKRRAYAASEAVKAADALLAALGL